ncbi:MarR family winged helix-turn-helix transcriptional regulator [Paenibacillus allorhizosphaerae]|uniref:Transcriptional regulator SlyA n=1 Tax=Paenibacillus allorhizosphaerae TaxID=2849866 RepID=A0ABM8VAI3_9BACL|nr:MarR family transcriptional regulator [Paenibacillus allorhizosphaerae]CAG7616571.1 Transcriptional regulator SlyA [Paenibacillus allorhizosphaerae]
MEQNVSLFFHMNQMYRQYIDQLNQLLSKYNLYSSQWAILYLLHYRGSNTLNEVAQMRNVEGPTITRLTNKLKDLGYVITVHGEDRRTKKITVTDHGVEIIKKIESEIAEFQNKITQGIPTEGMEMMNAYIATIHDNLKKQKGCHDWVQS